ncbi:hypothetical protein ALP8811_01804 [Aliiroseovarius pelagivivens]|uniref:Uncharacterized protein n=1 Tax=Aliiroseovarius pelagivivens TaxID=1639690 RepID=A0A2R8ALA5_9RHOB|nr:hypothetical protein ALP8811_01804 [Aliiroseovarius pelagivivens]
MLQAHPVLVGPDVRTDMRVHAVGVEVVEIARLSGKIAYGSQWFESF